MSLVRVIGPLAAAVGGTLFAWLATDEEPAKKPPEKPAAEKPAEKPLEKPAAS